MKARILIILVFALAVVGAFGQSTDNTIYVKQFPGVDVGTKVANAMATCNPDTRVPCILVIDASLATTAAGVMPTLCAQCSLVDNRAGINQILTPKTLNGKGYATRYSGADIGAQVNSAIAALPGGCGEVEIPAGTYAQSTSILKPRCVRLHGQGALGTILQWSGSSGAAVVAADTGSGSGYPDGELSDLTLCNSTCAQVAAAVTTATVTNNSTTMTVASSANIVIGMTVFGPYLQPGIKVTNVAGNSVTLSSGAYGSDSTGQTYSFSNSNAVGIYFGGDPLGVISSAGAFGDHQNINRVRIWGFPEGIRYGNNAWSITVTQSMIALNLVGVAFPSWVAGPGTINNSGESLSFIGTSIQNNINALNIIGWADFYFYASRCDYNISCGAVNSAHFFGMHFEQGSGHILTLAGTTAPNVQIVGGFMFLSAGSGSDADMIYVGAQNAASLNPTLKMTGTNIQASHTVTQVVNWIGGGSNQTLWIDGLPPHTTAATLTNNCTFQGCSIFDQNFSMTPGGIMSVPSIQTTAGGVGAYVGNSSGWAQVKGNGTGLLFTSSTSGSPSQIYLQDGSLNANGVLGNFGTYQLNGSTVIDASKNVTAGGGGQTIYRCTTAGTLPVGALTVATGLCGASTDTGLRGK